jgi:hypothetical protein
MINHRRRRLSKRGVGVVAEGHDAGIGDLPEQDISQPECLRLQVCPSLDRVAVESVHGHDTKGKGYGQQKMVKNGRSQPANLQEDSLDGRRRRCSLRERRR